MTPTAARTSKLTSNQRTLLFRFTGAGLVAVGTAILGVGFDGGLLSVSFGVMTLGWALVSLSSIAAFAMSRQAEAQLQEILVGKGGGV